MRRWIPWAFGFSLGLNVGLIVLLLIVARPGNGLMDMALPPMTEAALENFFRSKIDRVVKRVQLPAAEEEQLRASLRTGLSDVARQFPLMHDSRLKVMRMLVLDPANQKGLTEAEDDARRVHEELNLLLHDRVRAASLPLQPAQRQLLFEALQEELLPVGARLPKAGGDAKPQSGS